MPLDELKARHKTKKVAALNTKQNLVEDVAFLLEWVARLEALSESQGQAIKLLQAPIAKLDRDRFQ